MSWTGVLLVTRPSPFWIAIYTTHTGLPFGMTSHILKYNTDGETEEVANFLSLHLKNDVQGATRLTEWEDALYATVGAWHINWGLAPFDHFASVVKIDGDEITPVTNLWSYDQADNPNGEDMDEFEKPPLMASSLEDRRGCYMFADAGADAIFSIDPDSGEVSTLFRFPDSGHGRRTNWHRGNRRRHAIFYDLLETTTSLFTLLT